MAKPTGSLTGPQLEIMEILWRDSGEDGLTVAEIRDRVPPARDLARTTVLTTVQRLEKRGWLVRGDGERAARYCAARRRDQVETDLARGFVDEFFGGSAAQLVRSLLGGKKLRKTELARIRAALDDAEARR